MKGPLAPGGATVPPAPEGATLREDVPTPGEVPIPGVRAGEPGGAGPNTPAGLPTEPAGLPTPPEGPTPPAGLAPKPGRATSHPGAVTSPGAAFAAGLRAGFPVFLGYVPAAIAFGLLGRNAGLAWAETLSFSLFNFAGAGQYLTAALLAQGQSWVAITVSVWLLNLRHLLMAASLKARWTAEGHRGGALSFAWGVTDETFAVLSRHEGPLSRPFALGTILCAWSGWAGGTLIGALAGDILPVSLQRALGLVLYALFAVLLAPALRKKPRQAWLPALAGAALHQVLLGIGLDGGLALALAIAGGALIAGLAGPQDDPAPEVPPAP